MAKRKPARGATSVPALVPEQIDRSILVVRGRKVLLDEQLAGFYGVETKRLMEAVNHPCRVRKDAQGGAGGSAQGRGGMETLLKGLWFSGLRLGESLVVSWDEDAPISIDLSGKRPRLRIFAEAEKGNRDRLLPMTPDFAEFLLATPEADRHGRVFKIGRLNSPGSR